MQVPPATYSVFGKLNNLRRRGGGGRGESVIDSVREIGDYHVIIMSYDSYIYIGYIGTYTCNIYIYSTVCI